MHKILITSNTVRTLIYEVLYCLYLKINSLKHHKLKEEFEQIQIPHLYFYYLQEKNGLSRRKLLTSEKLSTLRISLNISSNYCSLKVTDPGEQPEKCKEASDSVVLRKGKCFCKNICIDVPSKQHFHHFNSLHSCCSSHPQGQRSHKDSSGI